MEDQKDHKDCLKEATILLQKSSSEIISLRKSNTIMSARLKMFDDMMLVLKMQPPTEGFEHREDVVANNLKFIKEHANN